MRHLWMASVLVAALTFPTISAPADLTMSIAINSGAFHCDGQTRYYVWWNPEPFRIKLKWTRVWQGVGGGSAGKSDFLVVLYTYDNVGQLPPYNLIHMVGWDHYANPTAPMSSVWTYEPDWVTINVGQGILMETSCTPFESGVMAHAAAFVGYIKY